MINRGSAKQSKGPNHSKGSTSLELSPKASLLHFPGFGNCLPNRSQEFQGFALKAPLGRFWSFPDSHTDLPAMLRALLHEVTQANKEDS